MDRLFNECMKCGRAVRKRMIGSGEWLVACAVDEHGTCTDVFRKRHYYHEGEVLELLKDHCPDFVEKMMEDWNEG